MGSVYVLVVDDNDLQRDVVADALSSVGYEVGVAANGADALREARARHPEIIVLDLMLPDTDGATVLAELRADPALAQVRVLVTTGVRAASVRRLPGVDLALFKPFGMSELLAAVESLVPPRAPRPERCARGRSPARRSRGPLPGPIPRCAGARGSKASRTARPIRTRRTARRAW